MVLYEDSKYKILKTKKDYVLCNKQGEYENHGHFKKLETCRMLIRLMEKNEVPSKSKYLQDAAIRISIDEKYIQKVINKQEKNKNRMYYYNPNKGVR